MSETPEKTSTEIQLRKHCTDGKMEEGGFGKFRIRKTSTDDATATEEKRKWPMLCDTNPYIVDFFKNLFKKEEPVQPEPDQQAKEN